MNTIEKNSFREKNIYDSFQVTEDVTLIVFRGMMNDQDIWIAEIEKGSEGWTTKQLLLMSAPIEVASGIQTIFEDLDAGYKVGYIKTDSSQRDNLHIVETEENSDWRIWLSSMDSF